jgi:hypothetical protein
MKNIHVIPTDKPSKLYKRNDLNTFHLGDYDVCRPDDTIRTNQNIYITNGEEIKEGIDQWYLDTFLNKPRNSSGSQYAEKQDVIILTTDQDLINDGVQAIDDGFLEWFVNNPSCEEVEVENSSVVKEHIFDGSNDGEVIWEYKIIIPKEEPKQELLPDFKITKNIFDFVTDLSDTKKEEPVSFESFDKEKSEAITTMGQKLVRELQSVLKKETLEEAAKKYAEGKSSVEVFQEAHIIDFNNGAKWQQENTSIYILDVDNVYAHIENGVVIIEKNDKSKISYSDDEVIKLLIKFNQEFQEVEDVRGWFEQNNK